MNTTDLELTLRKNKTRYSADLRLKGHGEAADNDLALGIPVSIDREALRQRSADYLAYGRELTRQLFANRRLQQAWARVQGILYGTGTPVRFRLRIDPEALGLHHLCWELLQDPLSRSSTFLALSERILFSRYLAGAELAPVRRALRHSLSALVVAANPADLAEYGLKPIDAVGEVERVRRALGTITTHTLASGQDSGPVTLSALLDALRSSPDILYIVAHGTLHQHTPYLWLENVSGRVARVEASHLVQLMSGLERMPLLVVLASCQSGGDGHDDLAFSMALGPRLAEAGVPAVMAMQGNISFETVAAVMPAFFRELQQTGAVDRALAAGRMAAMARPDWWAPSLFVRLSDGVLWEKDSVQVPALAPSPSAYQPGIPVPSEVPPYADPTFIESLPQPTGAVSVRSQLYIRRGADDQLEKALRKAFGTIVTLRAPRQSGKTSLLVRTLHKAKDSGQKCVIVNLQAVDSDSLQSLDHFLRYLADTIAVGVGRDYREVAEMWGKHPSPGSRMSNWLEHVLGEVSERLILTIDEADSLINTPFRDQFFGLARSWHNFQAYQEDPWSKLVMIFAISTEPGALIRNLDQSPFNVGELVWLNDFNQDQVAELNDRYRRPLAGSHLSSAYSLLHGHPYLTSRAFYTIVSEGISWDRLERTALHERGPFGDHLYNYLKTLLQQEDLRRELVQIIKAHRCSNEQIFMRLQRAGLVQGERASCDCRCQLYTEFFRMHLL